MTSKVGFSPTAAVPLAEIRSIMVLYNRRLYRVAWSILKDESAAEDAVQETYLQAFRHWSEFRGQSNLGTWLTRIVINQALMQKRKQRPAIELDNVQPSAEILRHPALISTDDPERSAVRTELRRLVEKAVGELPENFRLVFVLREVEGLSGEETASLLQIGEETVRTRLHRAKARLRAMLDAEVHDTLIESFPFAGRRCEAISARVICRLRDEGMVSQV
jgi:RNA polymerase sigma-70 factor (ECF subfamily)